MLAIVLLLLAAPAETDIHRILADRVDVQRQAVGIVAGVVDPSGRRVVVHGKAGGSAKLDGDTIFEIGSATKVFTALLLADAVARGDVALTDPISKYLPGEVKVPERGGRKITLQDLATHTSGLPRLPSNLAPKDPTNPYADYTVANLYEFLGGYQLTRDIGSEYEYSNFGAGLLGHILALRAGMTYEELVQKRITGPLGMKSTFIVIPEKAKARLAAGHDAELKPAANWDLPTLAGAGALRSTVNDLLIFLSANLGLTKSPLAAAMASTIAMRRPAARGAEVALGWHVAKSAGGNDIFWHNGGTGGYRSFVGFDPKTRTGVVLLSNTSTPEGVDDIGRHLLDPAAPLIKSRTQIAVTPEVLEKYTGRYELQPGFVLTVTRENDRLFAQLTGQPRFEIFPESEKKFFYRVVNAQITFEDGKSLVLHQNGRDVPARRLEGDVPAPKVRKEITLDEKILQRYVGRYELAPTFIITITREGNRLFLQATAQPRLEIFPESEREFFLKVVDAQVTFGDDHLVLHQNGMDQKAKKIE
jgi:serine-type D-Ala-D-Ala carboxypeptidase/endopeptidase